MNYITPVHRFRRCTDVRVVNGNAAYSVYQENSIFQLSDLLNVSEFTNLYDQYKIDYVVQKYYLRVDPSAQTAATANFPSLYWSRDYDSSTVLSQSEMRQRANMRTAILRPDRPIVIKYKPNLLAEAYSNPGSLTPALQPVWNKWIDISQASVYHYGHLWNINNFTNTNYRLEIETFVYFSCKSVR